VRSIEGMSVISAAERALILSGNAERLFARSLLAAW
jgi:hypothetical protein